MENAFVPKRTITIQVTLETQDRIKELAKERGITRTKLIEQIVEEAYIAEGTCNNDLSGKQCF